VSTSRLFPPSSSSLWFVGRRIAQCRIVRGGRVGFRVDLRGILFRGSVFRLVRAGWSRLSLDFWAVCCGVTGAFGGRGANAASRGCGLRNRWGFLCLGVLVVHLWCCLCGFFFMFCFDFHFLVWILWLADCS